MKRALSAGRLASLALVSAVVAVSCGDSDDTSTSTTSAASTSGSGGGSTSATSTGAGGKMQPQGVTIPDLDGDVKAVYDPNGILHLACKSDEDCYAALGYFHASNRFFFMDFVRNLVRGSLGALVAAGDPVLSQDYQNRLFFTTRDGDPLEEALYKQASAPVRGYMDAYTRGVNAWIADMRAGKNGATLTDEYDFSLIDKKAIRDWQSEDSAAVGLYVLNDLSNDSADEIAAGTEYEGFPTAIAVDLIAPEPVFDAFTIQGSGGAAPARQPLSPKVFERLAPYRALLTSAAEGISLLAAGSRDKKHVDDRGSNNWVAAPSRSKTGNALLANDPHLLLGNPSIWFPVELDAKSNGGKGVYHVAGGTFPGLPSIMIGHNESIGWGVTTAYYDLDDVYLESLTDDNASVNFKGSTVKLTTKEYSFDDSSTKKTIKKTFKWVPHHGPVVSEDDTAHTAVSIRWRGHDGGQDLDAFFGIAKAASVADAKTALGVASCANQNFVVVDTKGNIAWFPYSKVPLRTWASPLLPPWLPLPGDGTAEWGDPVDFSDLPQLENPAIGVIATANNDMTGASADGDPTNDGQPAIQSAYKADGTREQRIQDLLAAGGNTLDLDTFSTMQGDTYSLYGSVVVPKVLAAAKKATLTSDEQAVVDALTAWQYTCPTGLDGSDPVKSGKSTDPMESSESIGCTAFHVTFFSIVADALGDEAKKANVSLDGGIGIQLVARALKSPMTVTSGNLLWDDISTKGTVEKRDDILVKAITDAAAALATIGPKDEWRWGRIHTVTLASIFDNFGITTYNYGPFAAPGGLYTVDVGNPKHDSLVAGKVPDMSFGSGPSIRLLIEAKSTGPVMRFCLPGGEDLHHDSPFYNNLLPGWLANEPVDFPFGPGAVPKPAKTVEVSPR